MKVKIYYHHTDCGGVVYYANYLKFLEEARTEYLEERLGSMKDLVKSGVLFVVARQEIDYKAPSFYGDVLTVDTRVVETSAVKVTFEYDIRNQNNQLISKARTILVCVDSNLKPKAIPDTLKSALIK